MSGPFFPGYDAWKTREPAEDSGPVCDACGNWLRRDERSCWYCERCEEAAAPTCDTCGRPCSRTHQLVVYGIDTICCDDCAGYDAVAYGESPDPLLENPHG